MNREDGAVDGVRAADDPQAERLPDPLPSRWLLDPPVLHGRIKARAEDFLVDEIPLYEPAGEGEHLYLRVQKRHMAHGELIALLARHYDVAEEAIGFAGMKDRVGITQQTVSIHLPGRDDPPPPVDGRIELLWQARHVNKLRRGHLRGNRFAIRIREIDPLKVPLLWKRVERLVELGVPDFFGPQRFGYRRNNHVLGRLLLLGRHEALLAELLGARGSPFPEHQRQARELYDAGEARESLGLWHHGDFAERAALRALSAGAGAAKAVRAIRREHREFWVSSLQSAIFNRVLEDRIAEGRFGMLEEGDVAYRHDNGSLFLVTREDLDDRDPERELRGRHASFTISPSGPLPGPGMVAAAGRTLERERSAVDAFRAGALLDVAGADAAAVPEGTRRPLRVRVDHPSIDASFDEHGPYIRVAFDLPKGAYATVLLRELIVEDALIAAGD